jgi:hypothetical protein
MHVLRRVLMMRNTFHIGLLSILLFTWFLSFADASFWPKNEKELKDDYLKQLFTPEFPHEYVKVVENEKGQRFIVVRSKRKINKELVGKYYYYLLSRGVNIYGSFHFGVFSWQKTVSDFAITITRKVEGEPDTIEASESVVKDPKTGRPIIAATADGKEFRFAITDDLGKKWKKINLYPEKEPKEPFTRVGRYPGARLREVRGNSWLFYTSKDSFKDVTYFYEKRLKEQYSFFSSTLEYKGASERFDHPQKYTNPEKVFDIKTIAQEIRLRGSSPFKGKGSTDIYIYRALDPNLINYIEVFIVEGY